MPYDADKAGDVTEMKNKLEKTYKSVSDTAARQAIHVFNSVLEDTKDEGSAWGAVHSTMQKRGLSKKSSERLAILCDELEKISAELVKPFPGEPKVYIDQDRIRYSELYQKASNAAGYAMNPHTELEQMAQYLTAPEFAELRILYERYKYRGVHAASENSKLAWNPVLMPYAKHVTNAMDAMYQLQKIFRRSRDEETKKTFGPDVDRLARELDDLLESMEEYFNLRHGEYGEYVR